MKLQCECFTFTIILNRFSFLQHVDILIEQNIFYRLRSTIMRGSCAGNCVTKILKLSSPMILDLVRVCVIVEAKTKTINESEINDLLLRR